MPVIKSLLSLGLFGFLVLTVQAQNKNTAPVVVTKNENLGKLPTEKLLSLQDFESNIISKTPIVTNNSGHNSDNVASCSYQNEGIQYRCTFESNQLVRVRLEFVSDQKYIENKGDYDHEGLTLQPYANKTLEEWGKKENTKRYRAFLKAFETINGSPAKKIRDNIAVWEWGGKYCGDETNLNVHPELALNTVGAPHYTEVGSAPRDSQNITFVGENYSGQIPLSYNSASEGGMYIYQYFNIEVTSKFLSKAIAQTADAQRSDTIVKAMWKQEEKDAAINQALDEERKQKMIRKLVSLILEK